jgi:glycosyltransferase involved in cell wall biosynthesis
MHESEPSSDAPELSVVVPAYREARHLEQLVTVLERTLAPLGCGFEVLIVDDGSPDDTYAVVAELAQARPWLKGLRLSRNFGKEAALQAGLESAQGRAVVTMDADLQHPPEVIPQMLAAWRAGAQVVHATKQDRSAQGRTYSLGVGLITGFISRMTGIRLQDAADFKLLDREIVDILVTGLPERERFFRGLAQWVGFRQADIPFTVARGTREDRRWTLRNLVRLAVTALVSFTSLPMHIVTLLGFATLILSVVIGGDALISWLQGQSVSGFVTTILTLLILGSFIMISLGIIGVYIAKIHEEIKRRPLYFIQARTDHPRPGDAASNRPTMQAATRLTTDKPEQQAVAGAVPELEEAERQSAAEP